MIKFIHTADIHFGMENYGRIDQKTGIHSRLLDFKKALDFCIDTAIEQEVDFFLFSGDAYKTANPSPTQQKLLMECFFRLYKANIPAIIIVGNHDNPLSFGKAHALDVFGNLPLDGFYVVAKPTSFVLQTKNGPVQIVGIPWPLRTNIALAQHYIVRSAQELTEQISKSVCQIVAQFAQELKPELPAVLAGHLTVSNGIFSGSEKRAIYGTDPIFLPSQLAIPPFDYVALGHLHRHQQLNNNGHPPIVYAGSIERVDFGERKEAKGFCLVTLCKKNNTTYEFIKTPMRPFIQIEVHLQDSLDQTEQIVEKIKQHNIQEAIIKILYHLPAGSKDEVNIRSVYNACYQATFVVGIIPIRSIEIRAKRSALRVEMDLPTLLAAYFDTKPESYPKKNELIEKALALQMQLTQNQENKD